MPLRRTRNNGIMTAIKMKEKKKIAIIINRDVSRVLGHAKKIKTAIERGARRRIVRNKSLPGRFPAVSKRERVFKCQIPPFPLGGIYDRGEKKINGKTVKSFTGVRVTRIKYYIKYIIFRRV